MTDDAKARRRAAQAAYARQWRKKNPDKVKQYNQNYWDKKAREMEGMSNEADADSERIQGQG